jgi:hypothetical protein
MRFNILPELPNDGRIVLEFSENNEPVKPPSLIVSIHPKDTKSWTGNFQLGTGSLDTVIDHPDGKNIVVVAHGLAYVIDPHTRLLDMVMGDGFEYLVPVPAMNLLLVSNGLGFDAVRDGKLVWESKRISWFGFRGLMVAGNFLVGEAFSSLSDRWYRFKLDLNTGECNDGIYEREAAQFTKVMPEGPPPSQTP